MKSLITAALLLFACHASASPLFGEDQEVPPVDDNNPILEHAPTLDEILAILQADPLTQDDFIVCAEGECREFKKTAPSPAPKSSDTAEAVGRIGSSLARATAGRVTVTFTYTKNTVDANGVSTSESCTVTMEAAEGYGANTGGFNDAMGKQHR